MTIIYAFVAAGLFGCGLYMVLSRNLVRTILGLSLLTTAVNLMIFQTSRMTTDQPPLIAEGATTLSTSADPLPQALILTAIVIGFALTVVMATLALRVYRAHGSLNTTDIRSADELGSPTEKRDVR
jgi:multicomponent Na+:H+ antiporter subunit C